MVSPLATNDALIGALEEEGGGVQAAAGGNAFAWDAQTAIVGEPAGNLSPEYSQIISERGSTAWISQDIAGLGEEEKTLGIDVGHADEYYAFSSDLGEGLVQAKGATPLSSPPQEQTIYLRNTATGSYEPLVSAENTPPGTKFGGTVEFVGGNPELTHIVVSDAKVALTATPGSETPNADAPNLYEWTAGQLQLVSVLPDGSPTQSENATVHLGYQLINSNNVRHAISNDGAFVVYEASTQSGASGKSASHLYLRDVASNETVQIDAPEPGSSDEGYGNPVFQTASSNGKQIFFTDDEQLTEDATANGEEEHEPDLYVYEVASGASGPGAGHLTDLTVDANSGEDADVQGLLPGASEDGSYVYVVAEGVLAANENASHEIAEHGDDNLYVLHDTAGGWTTTFIAQLASGDENDWGRHAGELAQLTSRVSPSGRYLVFMSERELTGYDNADVNSGIADEEVFLYDAELGRLSCLSCDPDGAQPEGVDDLGNSSVNRHGKLLVDEAERWNEGRWLAGVVPGWVRTNVTHQYYQPRYLIDSGRVFFDSSADLVSGATNHKMDVYEYEPEGVGGCEAGTDSETQVFVADDGGCIALLSGGRSEEESAFLDASESGGDAFFLTAEKLVPQDTNTALDIYDAHECTEASPCLPPPLAPPVPCAGEACQGAAGASPLLATASTLTQAPGDNVLASSKPKKAKQAKPKKKTRAQKLANALKKCERKGKKKRAACKRSARKRYGAAKKASEGKKAKRAGKGRTLATRRGTSR